MYANLHTIIFDKTRKKNKKGLSSRQPFSLISHKTKLSDYTLKITNTIL